MSLVDLASSASAWRGYEYYIKGKVSECRPVEDGIFEGTVSGSGSAQYSVTIDIAHPRKSKCNCPHADGKRLVCKHMVALYFSAFPEEAKQYYDDIIRAEEEYEQEQEALADDVEAFVRSMKKSDLQEVLLQLLYDGPDWQFDRFVRDYLDN